jgi:hypothetical protein
VRKGPTNHSRESRAVANPGRASHIFLDLSLHREFTALQILKQQTVITWIYLINKVQWN